MLKKYNISPNEVVYLLLNFDAGQGFYKLDKSKKIKLSKYRKNILDNEETRRIWKYILKDRMFTYSPFTEAVDKYIQQIESNQNS